MRVVKASAQSTVRHQILLRRLIVNPQITRWHIRLNQITLILEDELNAVTITLAARSEAIDYIVDIDRTLYPVLVIAALALFASLIPLGIDLT